MRITSIQSVLTPRGVVPFTHDHSKGHEFHYIVHGTGIFKSGFKAFKFVDGTLFYSPPETKHSLAMEAGEGAGLFFTMMFEPGHGDDKLMAAFARMFSKLGGGGLDLGFSACRRFEDIKRKHLSGDKVMSQSAVHDLYAFLLELSAGPPGAMPSRDKRVEEIVDTMRRSVYGKFNLASTAERYKMSGEHLIRLFKSTLGVSPKHYFLSLKMDTAAYLLKNTDWTIYAVADKLGFSDEFHFSRLFKRYMQRPPSSFRKDG